MDYVDSKVSGLGYELCSTIHYEKMRGGETGLEEKMISILDVLSLKYRWDMCEEKLIRLLNKPNQLEREGLKAQK